jgi:hypothetical protein
MSFFILLSSFANLLGDSPLPTLLRGVRTAVGMASRAQERDDVPIPRGEASSHSGPLTSSPDHLSRHDMAIQESRGESAWQFTFQWFFYLLSVKIVFTWPAGTEALDSGITFYSYSFLSSSVLSLLSLVMGQVKVHCPIISVSYKSATPG